MTALLERTLLPYLEAERARRHLVDFCLQMDPTYEQAAHTAALLDRLEAVERGELKRLLVFMPPRHSKTYHVSERFPAWFLGRSPSARVILASYGAELAERASRIVRNLLTDERWPFRHVGVAGDSAAVNRWGTTHGGELIAAGVGGAMTGFGADLLLIDDPVKGRAEADSDVVRDSTWAWYAEVARTRLMPGGRIVLCATRWHEDDLAGRILASRGRSDWEVLSLPALAEDADPLGRPRGAPLWPAWFDTAALDEIKRDLTTEQGSRAWLALYQQRPTAEEGGMFKRAWFKTRYDARPETPLRVLGVDSAFKDGVQNDYSALVTLGSTGTTYPVVEAVQGRWQYPELRRQVLAAAERVRPHAIVIEDTASGQSILQELRLSTSLPVVPIKVTASKEARAAAVAPTCEAGRVVLPNVSDWHADLLDQLAAFPAGAHDDLVDAFVHALGYLAVLSSRQQRLRSSDVTLGSSSVPGERAFERLRRVGGVAPVSVRR